MLCSKNRPIITRNNSTDCSDGYKTCEDKQEMATTETPLPYPDTTKTTNTMTIQTTTPSNTIASPTTLMTESSYPLPIHSHPPSLPSLKNHPYEATMLTWSDPLTTELPAPTGIANPPNNTALNKSMTSLRQKLKNKKEKQPTIIILSLMPFTHETNGTLHPLQLTRATTDCLLTNQSHIKKTISMK